MNDELSIKTFIMLSDIDWLTVEVSQSHVYPTPPYIKKNKLPTIKDGAAATFAILPFLTQPLFSH